VPEQDLARLTELSLKVEFWANAGIECRREAVKEIEEKLSWNENIFEENARCRNHAR
jgi:hypothetical protein